MPTRFGCKSITDYRNSERVKMRIKNKQEEAIEAGGVLLTEKPFVYIVNSKHRNEICDNCFNKGNLLKCSGCRYVHYCNRACQKEVWTDHKSECASLRRVSPLEVPDSVRLLARIIMKLSRGGDQLKGYYTKTSFRMFKDLMSHYPDIKQDQRRMEFFSTICAVLFEYIGEKFIPNTAELMGIYGRLCINGFNILDPEMMSIGTGIYLGVSILDHSCDPNAVAVFEGSTIYVRALEPIPNLDFSKIFISYIDLLNSPAERQEELQQSYYFLCGCNRCTIEADECVDDTAACPNADCTLPIVVSKAPKTCDGCGTGISDEFVDTFTDVKEYTQMHLQIMKQKSMVYLDVCKMCLKKQRGVMHPLNVLHVKTLDGAFESSIEIEQWDDAIQYGIQSIQGFKKYHGEKHPLLGILYLKIGKILIHQNRSREAVRHLRDAAEILKVTHGTGNPLYRSELSPLLNQALMESSMILQPNGYS